MKNIRLLMGPGTLHSQGVDRMDMLRYGVWISGRQPLDGHALLAAVPEIAEFAAVTVDDKKSIRHRHIRRFARPRVTHE